MSANQAAVVLVEVANDLFDPTHQRWSLSTLINYLNRGMRDIANKIPAASTKIVSLPIVAGALQTITGEAGAKFLIGIENLQYIDGATMDAEDPTWKISTPASDTTQGFVYDRKSPFEFWLYPPRVNTGTVDANLAVDPTAVTDSTDTLPLSDAYIPALYNFVMASALAREGETQNLEKAGTYLSLYNAQVTA